MILSDRSLREALAGGRIIIDPVADDAIQPSSIDLHVDRFFRVFRNDTTPFIDPKQSQEDLTELVEVPDGQAFILHPGEFVLGSTLERVALPDDMVARLEGKSSLGRLGLLIHSSLPGSETVMVLQSGRLEPRPITDMVRKQLQGFVVAFDPETFEVGYHEITGWYEGPPDQIFEIVLASGRRVRVTAGHNLFSLDRDGRLRKVRTQELRPGTRVAVPRSIPDPSPTDPVLHLLDLVPESAYSKVVCTGPSVAAVFAQWPATIRGMLRGIGIKHNEYWQSRSRLPLSVARQLPDLLECLGQEDRLTVRGSPRGLQPMIDIDDEFAWFLGMYVAEGSRRANQFTISNTDQVLLDRVVGVLTSLGLPVYRGTGAVTCCSSFASAVLGWLGTGEYAPTKRVPPIVFGWPQRLMQSFLDGLVDGDGSREDSRTSVWTSSDGLAGDVLLLASRLGLRAGSSYRARSKGGLHQVYMPKREHKLLTSVPLPDHLLVGLRVGAGIDQTAASKLAGYRCSNDLNNIERRHGRDAVRLRTLRRLRDAYEPYIASTSLAPLTRLVDGDVLWDRVVDVRDTGMVEPIFDLEVRPNGQRIENFLAGSGGVFVSNTAGFVDAGWDGHLTLELSNVATLPIAIYPGMRIGQISFLQMTTPADHPYGSGATGSKYQGQRGPTPSRYYLNFRDDD